MAIAIMAATLSCQSGIRYGNKAGRNTLSRAITNAKESMRLTATPEQIEWRWSRSTSAALRFLPVVFRLELLERVSFQSLEALVLKLSMTDLLSCGPTVMVCSCVP